MRIIPEEKLTEYLENVGSESLIKAECLVNLLEDLAKLDPFLYQRPKGKPGRPTKYPFRDMPVNDVIVILFDDKKDVRRAKCAANTLAYLHGLRFVVKSRQNDAGKFELTVKRVG